MERPKRFVYVIKNAPAERLEAHNAGRCSHTEARRPWRMDVLIEFSDEHRAVAFERYLKSGSGSAFAIRHLR